MAGLVPLRPRGYTLHNDAAPGLYEPAPALTWLREYMAVLDDHVADPVFDGPLQPDGIHWGLGWMGHVTRMKPEEDVT